MRLTDNMRPAPLALRCSGLPLNFLCPGSCRPEGVLINESGAEAALGSAAHEGLAIVAETGRVDWSGVSEIARRWRVTDDEPALRALLAQGARLWAEVKSLFPSPTTERELVYVDPAGAFVLSGHADVMSWVGGGLVRIADQKTGRRDADYGEQLRGYCFLALDSSNGSATAAEGHVLWVRDHEIESYRMSQSDAAAWLDRVRSEIVEWDGVYHPGPHCPHCPRSHECPAGLALVRRDVAAITGDEGLAHRFESGDALAAMAPDEVVSLLARADLAVHVGARVRAAIKALIVRDGDLVGGGRRLTLQHEERRELETLVAFPLLVAAGFDDDDLAEVTSMSLAAAERVVKRKAPRGKGAAAARELEATLAAAGAINITTTTKLVTKRQ